ncbi:3-oxoacyl-(acyl-carrier-protein) synthase [Allocatelliglobosispora scoriae]|uniref:3-oxoacyl-(Acyl-carrier-protein) synthase n=1 Tax=Allocatelliglobosispora scoriae TaxID=643052 RepID=A0A841BQ14_9ACTN|nr:3-oxoacyl-(acyl-carrier-protein) synthase [Allocatelliglobosispora scoriae]
MPLLSTKPVYGHTLGAASALDVAATALAVQRGEVFDTLNVDRALAPPDLAFGPVPGGTA